MIRITPLALVVGSLLFAGCGTEPFTLEKQGAKVAASMGVPAESLRFVSAGDVARPEDLQKGFSESTKGVIAMTDTEILWVLGSWDEGKLATVNRLPFAQIEGVAYDGGVIQFEVNGDWLVVRPHGKSRYEADMAKTREIGVILSWKNLPMTIAPQSYYYVRSGPRVARQAGFTEDSSAARAMGDR